MKSENDDGQTQTLSCDYFQSTAIFKVKMANTNPSVGVN